jgi:hypothetical protein
LAQNTHDDRQSAVSCWCLAGINHAEHGLRRVARDDVNIIFVVIDADGNPVDLTGATICCDAHLQGGPPIPWDGLLSRRPNGGGTRALHVVEDGDLQ